MTHTISYILLILALCIFGISAFWRNRPNPPTWDLISLGLFFWVLSQVINTVPGN